MAVRMHRQTDNLALTEHLFRRGADNNYAPLFLFYNKEAISEPMCP